MQTRQVERTDRRKKTFRGREDDTNLVNSRLSVLYDTLSTNRYKRVDELDLKDGKTIKANLSPVDMKILPYAYNTPYVVLKTEENRLDIIAHKIYGKASLYWVICYANNISDPYNVPAGTILFLPDFASLYEFPNPLY